MVPVPCVPGAMLLEGVATPVPFPVLTSGGDYRWSLGQSTYSTTTLSGFSEVPVPQSRPQLATLREIVPAGTSVLA